MLKNKYILFSIAVFISFANTIAQDRFDSLVTAGIHQIYNIKYNEANSTFNTLIKEYPDHPAGYFFDAMVIWWKIALDLEDESYDDEFIDKLEFVIDFCDDLLDENPDNVDAIFFKGGALGFRGRLYSIREDWFDAALDGKEALPLVNRAYEIDPGNVDVQLGFGIYNYYAEAVPEKYPFVKPFMIFFPRGDKKKGLKQLEYVAAKGQYAKYESLYFLATIYYSFEEKYSKAVEYLDRLVAEFPDNPRFQRLLGRTWVKRNNYNVASKIFMDIVSRFNRNLPGYDLKAAREAYYYIGMNYRHKEEVDSAKKYFELCEQASKQVNEDEPSGFLINAALYTGYMYDKLGRREDALKKYKEVLEYDDYKGSHDSAERYIKTPYK